MKQKQAIDLDSKDSKGFKSSGKSPRVPVFSPFSTFGIIGGQAEKQRIKDAEAVKKIAIRNRLIEKIVDEIEETTKGPELTINQFNKRPHPLLKNEAKVLFDLYFSVKGFHHGFIDVDAKNAFLERIKDWKETGELKTTQVYSDPLDKESADKPRVP